MRPTVLHHGIDFRGSSFVCGGELDISRRFAVHARSGPLKASSCSRLVQA